MEIWKDIYKYEGLYQVSNYGKIKSFPRKYQTKIRTLKPYKDKGGYLQVNLCKNNTTKTHKVHRLVLETFIGICPQGMEGCHNDGNPSNNFIKNLRWDTRKNNVKDAIKHNTHIDPPKLIGSKNHMTKFDNNQVINILEMFKNGKTIKEISKLLSVTHSCISHIVHRRSWKHINF